MEGANQVREDGFEARDLIGTAFELEAIKRFVAIDEKDFVYPGATVLRIVIAVLGKQGGVAEKLQLAILEDFHALGTFKSAQTVQMVAEVLNQTDWHDPRVLGGRPR